MPFIANQRFFRAFFRCYSNSSHNNLVNLLKTMPKAPKHIAGAQVQRKKIKEKSLKYVPGRVTLQVLGTGAEGAPRSLYVFSDQSRYLFQCGEGTQRLAHEHKMKLAKLEHIFITQPVWKNIGGLPGIALTIQDVGVPQVTLHGPDGLNDIFKATRRFIVLRDLKISMANCTEDNSFEDSVMSVKYVPIRKSQPANGLEKIEEESSSSSCDSEDCNKSVQIETEMKDAETSTRSSRSRRRSKSLNQNENLVIDEDTTDYYAHERKRSRNRKRSKSRRKNRSFSESGQRTTPETIPEYKKLFLNQIKDEAISMAFICRLQPRPGALSVEKCAEFGVPPGPLLGKLKSGQDVTLSSGVTVKSSDVCEPDDPGPIFIVVDCPSEDYLDSLTSNDAFKKHQSKAVCDEDLAYLVVHFSPKHVIENPRYQNWIDDFSPSTQHILLNDGNTCMGSIAVHRIQHKLNLLSENLFPLLGDKGTAVSEDQISPPLPKKLKSNNLQAENDSASNNGTQAASETTTQQIQNLSVKSEPSSPNAGLIQANTFCTFHLRPRLGLDRSNELKLCPQEYVSETSSLSGFLEELNTMKTKVLEARSSMKISPYPKVLFLGTGSCIPNKTRNTSGILIQLSEDLNILADCGEGTYGQIVRFFGIDKASEVLANLNGIFVSHLHADHHIGLFGLLQGRRRALERLKLKKKSVILMAPKQILNWLNFYDTCFESISKEYELIPNQDLMLPGQINDMKRLISKKLDLFDIQTTYVRHCPNAFGVAFRHRSGYKITYSGDTMPSENLVDIGTDSDLLIHEATMEDDLAHEAIIKMHSTTSQAIDIGLKMRAKHILLTHFSQRYAKLPRFNDNFKENVGIAFDNMHISIDELPLVPLLYPALKIMFAEHYEELEHKAVKRQLKIEREASKDRVSST